MKIKILVCVLVAMVALYTATINTGFGGPSLAEIKAAAASNKKPNEFIELSAPTIVKRWPKFVLSGDQQFYYTQNATLKEDYVRDVGSLVWQKQCAAGREGLTLNNDLADTLVYETVATKGSTLKLHGNMKAYRKNDNWNFTAQRSRLENNQEYFSGVPVSTIDNPLLLHSAQFERLCQLIFIE